MLISVSGGEEMPSLCFPPRRSMVNQWDIIIFLGMTILLGLSTICTIRTTHRVSSPLLTIRTLSLSKCRNSLAQSQIAAANSVAG